MDLNKPNMATSSEEEDSAGYIAAVKLVTASVLPMALRFATELNLLELIGNGGDASASELAAQLPATNPEAAAMIDRVLRLLTAHSVLTRALPDGGDEWRYSLTPVCKHLIRNEDGVSLAPFSLLIQDKIFIETW